MPTLYINSLDQRNKLRTSTADPAKKKKNRKRNAPTPLSVCQNGQGTIAPGIQTSDDITDASLIVLAFQHPNQSVTLFVFVFRNTAASRCRTSQSNTTAVRSCNGHPTPHHNGVKACFSLTGPGDPAPRHSIRRRARRASSRPPALSPNARPSRAKAPR